jgi:NADH dehydrogenase
MLQSYIVKKHKVLICGGGFGGVKTALDLSDDPSFEITLITSHTDFYNYPTMYLTATGKKKLVSSIPIKDIIESRNNIKLVIDEVVGLDRQNHCVETKSKSKYNYEAVVFALGVETNFFGIDGLQDRAYGIKSSSDTMKFRQHVHDQIIHQKKLDHHYAVVGGGPSGVELAGELKSYLRELCKNSNMSFRSLHVDLIEAAPRLLPRSPKDVSKRVTRQLRKLGVHVMTNAAVQSQTDDSLVVNNKPIRSHTVVWTAGVMNNPFFANNSFQLSPNKKVRVDQFLQTEPGIYVIGDNADTPYSGMAQTALYDAVFVAKNLKKIAHDKDPEPYHAKKPIYVFPAGPKWAAVQWGRLRVYGRLGYMIRSLADLVAYSDYEPWWNATKRWMALDDPEETCPTCK